jgi:hypothetical protein
MTLRGTRAAGRRERGANTERQRSISAGRIHFAQGAEIGLRASHAEPHSAWEIAGAHIAELIKTMLEKKASGVALAQMERSAGA